MNKTAKIADTIAQALRGENAEIREAYPPYGALGEAEEEALLLRAARNVEQVLMPDEDVVLERVQRTLEGYLTPGTSVYDLAVAVIQAVMGET